MDASMPVSDLMSTDVATLRRNDKLSIADDVMRLGRIRHLPVVDDDGKVVGLLSQRDLFRGALATALGYGEHGQQKLMELLLVKEVMTSDVITVTGDVLIADAARTMVDRKLGCLPVVDDAGEPIGIVTESDFVRLVLSDS
jgi:CBS domain-containing membrane protein